MLIRVASLQRCYLSGLSSTPEKMKIVPIRTPVIDPSGLKACEGSGDARRSRIAKLRDEWVRRRLEKR